MQRITVFTPAYNRAATLHRVYDSLLQQSFRDFEWLVVDDGSTDQTPALIKQYQESNPFFPIRYVYQPNGGKHIAINKGVSLASGEWFYIADSDDALRPDALQVFMDAWQQIPASAQKYYAGIVACCKNQAGVRISDPVPANPYDGNWRDLFYKHKFRKEATNINRTAIMKEFPFPDAIRNIYFPEAIVWRKMSDTYKIRLIDEEIRIYYIEPATESLMSAKKQHVAKALSACIETADILNNDLSYFLKDPLYFLKAALIYRAYHPFLHSKNYPLLALKKNAIIFAAPFLIPGWIIHLFLRRKDRQQAG